jgi:hypothetical protein
MRQLPGFSALLFRNLLIFSCALAPLCAQAPYPQQPYPPPSQYPQQQYPPAQGQYPPPQGQYPAPPYPQAQYGQPPLLAPQQLDQLVSRIALYPDSLLAQVLTATTYSNEIPDAATWACCDLWKTWTCWK